MALWSTPTRIEAFNLYMTQEWFDTQRYVDQLTGEFKGNRITQVGHAIHSIIENRHSLPSGRKRNDILVMEDILFDRQSVDDMLEQLPDDGGHAEIKGRLPVHTPYGTITLYGRTDKIYGLTVSDYKTMRSPTDAITLMQSYQWRIYLQMFNAFRFNYELISYHDPEQLETEANLGLPVRVEYDSQLKLYTYPNIQQDIERKCTEFIACMYKLGLQQKIGAE